jgi:hypothetical protein
VASKPSERPQFARSFPKDAALDSLVDAFERGDYARVRKEAPELAKSSDDSEVKAAALELRRRIDPDPLALILMFLAVALLAVLASYYWTHKHT